MIEVHPDKPKNVTCETWRSSPFISCSWEKGRETHLPTAYNISVRRYGSVQWQVKMQPRYLSMFSTCSTIRENGTLILSDHIKNAETVNISRLVMDEDTKYQLSITDYNQFGDSQSYLIFCVKDIGMLTSWHSLTLKQFLSFYKISLTGDPASNRCWYSCSFNIQQKTSVFSHVPVLPETPRIMQISFRNNSVEAFLQWNTTEPSEHLRAFIHLRTHGGDWVKSCYGFVGRRISFYVENRKRSTDDFISSCVLRQQDMEQSSTKVW